MTEHELMHAVLAHVDAQVKSGRWSIDVVSVGIVARTVIVGQNASAVDAGSRRIRVDLLRRGLQGKPDLAADLDLVPAYVKPEALGATLDRLYAELGT